MDGQDRADFRVQTYQGKPVLTWWEGKLFVGDGDGVGQVLDTNYKPVATVRTGNGYTFDLHEFTITPRNTALVLAYERYNREPEGLRRPEGRQDRRQHRPGGRPRDRARALRVAQLRQRLAGRVQHPGARRRRAPSGSTSTPTRSTSTADGNFLVSARNTSTIYKINRATGKIMWRLGGKKSDFKLGPGVRFDWQHSVRAQPDGTLKLYDNSAAPPVRKASRAITVKLDTTAKTATLVSAFTHPRKLLSASQGNVERLPNGDVFVGWGSQRWFTEFSPSGEVLFDGRLARGNDNYRAFRYAWTGPPSQPPKVVAERGGRQDHRPRELERRDRRRPLGAAGRRGRERARPDRLRPRRTASRPR